MKKVYILLITLFSSAFAQAQTASAVVFAEMGEKFTLYLNGEPQNTTPQVNVKVSGLTSEYYQARIDFENPMLEDFANNNFAVAKGFESTYIIKPGKKGGYVLRYNGQSEITATTSTPNVATNTNAETKKFAEVDDDVEEVKEEETAKVQTSGTTTTTAPKGGVTTTTTTTTKTNPAKPVKGENVNVGMNVGGVNMGININVTDTEMETEESETVVEKTVTTTQTTTSGTPKPAKPREEVVIVKEVVGQGACASPMSKDSFATAKNNISGKSFEDSKLTVAKQIAKSNCLTAQQISEILKVFGFEDSRLDFAKYAYDYCYNQNEYYLINESFQFESTIEELDAYLATKK